MIGEADWATKARVARVTRSVAGKVRSRMTMRPFAQPVALDRY
jgi:hypothetical protein